MRPVRAAQSDTSASVRSGIASVSRPTRMAELERSKSDPPYWLPVRLSTGVGPLSAVARHGVMLDQLLVQLESETGPVRYAHAAAGVDPRLVHEHLAQGGGGPSRRLVWKLEPGVVGDGSHEVQVRQQTDAMRPRVRGHEETGTLGVRGGSPPPPGCRRADRRSGSGASPP